MQPMHGRQLRQRQITLQRLPILASWATFALKSAAYLFLLFGISLTLFRW